jgi:hypothetical protein
VFLCGHEIEEERAGGMDGMKAVYNIHLGRRKLVGTVGGVLRDRRG